MHWGIYLFVLSESLKMYFATQAKIENIFQYQMLDRFA